MADHALPPPAVVMNMLMGSWIAQALGAAARLGIADALKDGPKDSATVAAKVGADPDCTRRLLRALSAVGVFASPEPDRWALTPVGECLRSDVEGSMKDFAIAETDHAHWAAWERFTDAVRTGQPQAEAALGCSAWDYYQQHPEDGATFSRAMTGISGMAIGPVLESYDFGGLEVIADVGGAHGTLLCAVLSANPGARGILFDLPHVVDAATATLEQSGLGSRIRCTGGSFLEQPVPTADLYLLKHILHDWNDDSSVKILENIREGMKPTSRILVVELVVPETPEPGPAPLMDLNMMVAVGGKERSAAEYETLFRRAGLRTQRLIPTKSPFVLLEVGPA